ncbi:MAG: uracil-DNA glycosylase family protein [Oscillospiraceae bacterium]
MYDILITFSEGISMGLEELRAECLKCEKCGLCATRHNVVFGVGNPHADVLFIGEGPGENEDLQGEPFVGRGGQLLDKMLSVVDLSREKNIYIANMVKCRPPKNRDPEEEEVAACRGWLQKQIELIDPKIIVCLGRISAIRFIDPNFKVTKEHGQFIEKDGRLVMGTMHPAALLRNPHSKPAAMEDFFALQEKIKEICPGTYENI